MFRLVLVCAIVAAVSAQQEIPKCFRLFGPDAPKCCSKLSSNVKEIYDDLKDCFDNPSKNGSCDLDICIAKKKGFLSGTNSFDKDALLDLMDKHYADKELKDHVKTTCLEGDLTKYGLPDMCDLIKLHRCIRLTVLSTCPEWNDKGDCSGMGDLVDTCAKLIASRSM